jgi:hypothetical protein
VGDHGELFTLAVIVFVCSLGTLYLHRGEVTKTLASVRG